MRALVQRVTRASVSVVAEKPIAAIESGPLTLLGVKNGDSEAECDRLACKVVALHNL